ncbi:unnamed protein product, partial [Ectocarpus fasciculatus]
MGEKQMEGVMNLNSRCAASDTNNQQPPEPSHNKRSSSSLTARTLVVVVMLAVVGGLCYNVFFGTAVGDIAAGVPISRKGYRVGSVSLPGVVSEGFHARRRAMAMTGVANGRERVVGEPAGFVFQDTENEEGNWLPAATLFAAAGPPVVVLDRADHLQNMIRRCIDEDGGNPAGITHEIRSQLSALVLEGLKSATEPQSASREDDATGNYDASSPSSAIIGHVDDEIDDPSWPTGTDNTATPRELVDARGFHGGSGTEWDGGGVGAASSLATAASSGSRVGNGEEHVLAEAVSCGDAGKGQALEGRVHGGWCDAWSRGQGALRGGGGDAELGTTVLVVSGWRWDEVETLLEVFPGTPWLYLHHEGGDGTSKPCPQSSSRYTGMRSMHDSKRNNHGHGVAMASSRLTAGAAARVLTRLFGAKLHPSGELAMSQLHARYATTDDEKLSTNEADAGESHSAATAATATAAAAEGFPSLDEGFPSDGSVSYVDTCQDLSRENAKVLGGPFDTVWWWGSGDNLTSNRVLERHRRWGVEGGSPCGSSSKETLGIASSINGDAEGQRKSYVDHDEAGGLGKKSGNSGSEKGTGENGLFHNSSSSASAAAAFAATEEGGGRRDDDDVKGSPLLVEEEGLAMVMGEQDPQRRWDRGLRRMVDGDSPSWMSSEVYSEPIERLSCPEEPETGYPTEWPLLDLLANWNPGNASGVPERHFLGVCRFDYQTELHKAQAYSLREV